MGKTSHSCQPPVWLNGPGSICFVLAAVACGTAAGFYMTDDSSEQSGNDRHKDEQSLAPLTDPTSMCSQEGIGKPFWGVVDPPPNLSHQEGTFSPSELISNAYFEPNAFVPGKVALFIAAKTMANDTFNRFSPALINVCPLVGCWLSSGFAVHWRYAENTDEAIGHLQDVVNTSNGKISHLTIHTHGSPSQILWSRERQLTSDAQDKLQFSKTQEFLVKVKASTAENATIMLSACNVAKITTQNRTEEFARFRSAQTVFELFAQKLQPRQVLGSPLPISGKHTEALNNPSDAGLGQHVCWAHETSSVRLPKPMMSPKRCQGMLAQPTFPLLRSVLKFTDGSTRPPPCWSLRWLSDSGDIGRPREWTHSLCEGGWTRENNAWQPDCSLPRECRNPKLCLEPKVKCVASDGQVATASFSHLPKEEYNTWARNLTITAGAKSLLYGSHNSADPKAIVWCEVKVEKRDRQKGEDQVPACGAGHAATIFEPDCSYDAPQPNDTCAD